MDRIADLSLRFAAEPLARRLGIALVSLAHGSAVLAMRTTADDLVVGGIVQGGIITTLADYAGVYAAMSAVPSGHTPAANIAIQFLRPTFEGEDLVARADVVEDARRTLVVSVTVDGGGKRKARATIVFAKPRPSP